MNPETAAHGVLGRPRVSRQVSVYLGPTSPLADEVTDPASRGQPEAGREAALTNRRSTGCIWRLEAKSSRPPQLKVVPRA